MEDSFTGRGFLSPRAVKAGAGGKNAGAKAI
jgi:hypothetical protein